MEQSDGEGGASKKRQKRNNHLNDGLIETCSNFYGSSHDHEDNRIMNYSMPDKYEKSIFMAGEREIHFNAHVDIETITRMKKLISHVVDDNKRLLVKYQDDGSVPPGQENEEDFVITYIVNSPGGSVHDILDFVDYIGFLRHTFANIKFISIITGLVASAGTIMCVIADDRRMTRFAYAMIHELSTGVARTNYTRIQTHAEFTRKMHEDLVTIYQECRGIDVKDEAETKKLEVLLLRESWMTAEEYREHGFVHTIICNKKRRSA